MGGESRRESLGLLIVRRVCRRWVLEARGVSFRENEGFIRVPPHFWCLCTGVQNRARTDRY